jgi:hypothetical protein
VPPLPYPPEPVLRHRRDGILPNVAAALTVNGTTLTGTAARGDLPDLHPLVSAVLDGLTVEERDRFTGRCAEALLISRHLDAADAERHKKRTKRKPMSNSEARKALKNATLTARRIREEGDPLHGTVARPCRACTALAAHFGVRIVAPDPDSP